MAVSVATLSNAMKDYYSPLRVAQQFLEAKAFSVIPKNTKYEGDKFVHPVQSALGAGYSADASVAFSNSSPAAPRFSRWEIDPVHAYNGRVITGDVIDRVRSMAGSFVGSAVALSQDDTMKEFVSATGAYIWGDGSGSLGTVASVSGNNLTLTNPSDALKFRIGQVVQSFVSGNPAVESGTATLATVDPDTGILTTTVATWATAIGTIAAGQGLVQQGTYLAVFGGIPAWIPTYDARAAGILATTFNNVARSANPVILAGSVLAGNGAPKVSTLERLAVKIQQVGGTAPDYAFVSFDDYADFLEYLGTRAQIVTDSAYKMPQVSFPAMQLSTAIGTVKIVPDQFVPPDNAWVINSKDWEFFSTGAYPYTRLHDGLVLRMLEQSDNYMYGIKGLGNLYCRRPFAQGTCRFS